MGLPLVTRHPRYVNLLWEIPETLGFVREVIICLLGMQNSVKTPSLPPPDVLPPV